MKSSLMKLNYMSTFSGEGQIKIQHWGPKFKIGDYKEEVLFSPNPAEHKANLSLSSTSPHSEMGR
jgi:hypothetical protein